MKTFFLLLAFPGLLFAQTPPAPGFAAEAKPLEAEALRLRVNGKAFSYQTAAGNTVRVEYKENGYAFANTGASSDSGKWRIEESAVCVEWSRFPSGCSEFRSLGNALQVKLKSNGEIVVLNAR
ncbi:hypothetical protein [Polaromonas sp.]|jgi:hypothetical protein|uniref:hypothetical protein n=1 Tax=Polaromonas sp. TaxID=1869339 RepID=UPI0037CBA61E